MECICTVGIRKIYEFQKINQINNWGVFVLDLNLNIVKLLTTFNVKVICLNLTENGERSGCVKFLKFFRQLFGKICFWLQNLIWQIIENNKFFNK